MAESIIVATWKFGEVAVRAGLPILTAGAPALDAALAGAQAVEDDPAVNSVGFGGLANAIGNISLDACVMNGKTLGCGAVAAVENVRHVAALARLVMEKTPHLMLAGEGARLFAVQNGFPLECLATCQSLATWAARKDTKSADHLSHDTVTVLALDGQGSLAGVCTTSGLSHKLPGRVGDSPIIGAGLYVDDSAGAAGATGVGEEILRISASSLMVEAMRTGLSPQQACASAARRVLDVATRRRVQPAQVAFLALDPHGHVGAACTAGTGFHYAVGRGTTVEVSQAIAIG